MIDVMVLRVSGEAWRDLLELDEKLAPGGLSAGFKEVLDEAFATQVRTRFEKEGDSTVGRWKELHPVTKKIREWMAQKYRLPIGAAHPINVRTGALKGWATSGEGGIAPVGGDAWLYQYPGQDPTGRLLDKITGAQEGEKGPARPVFGIGPIEAAAVTKLTETYLGFN